MLASRPLLQQLSALTLRAPVRTLASHAPTSTKTNAAATAEPLVRPQRQVKKMNVRERSLAATLAHFNTPLETKTTTITAKRPGVRRFLADSGASQQQQQQQTSGKGSALVTLPVDARSQLFDRAKHPHTCITPGSIVAVTSLTSTTKRKPVHFTGYVIAIRRKGIDTSMTLRNYVLKTGVEQTYKVYSPMVTDIRVLKYGDWARRAKLYYLRDQPNKVNWNIANENISAKSNKQQQQQQK